MIGSYENGLLYTTKICVPYNKPLTFTIMYNGGTYDGQFKLESDCNVFVSGTQFLDFYTSEFHIVEPDEEVEFELFYGGQGNDYGLLGEQTCDGGFVVAGIINRTGHENDIFFQKISHYGDTLWTKYYGSDEIESLTGLVKSPGENYIMLAGYGTNNQQLIKVDYQGDILWSVDLPVDPKKNNPYVRLFATREDTYVIIRYFQSIVEYDIFDGTGEKIMDSYFSSGGRARFYASGISQMEDGRLLIYGIINGITIQGDPFKYALVYIADEQKFVDYKEYNFRINYIKEAFPISENELYLLCSDTTGSTLMLTSNFDGEVLNEVKLDANPNDMIRTSDNGFILCYSNIGSGSTYSVIQKLDSSLNLKWEREIHKDDHHLVIHSVRETMQGGYYFTGSMESTFSGLRDIYILKTNSTGEGCFYRPYGEEDICLVTADINTGKNIIIWEKTPGEGTEYYYIYRDDELVATQPYTDLSIYVDNEVDPETRPFLYKISVVDSCGNESASSPYHKPLFLQYVSSVDGINLNWSKYEIEDSEPGFTGYDIYRGTEKNSVSQYVTDIPLEVDRYTDKDAAALVTPYYYRVAGVLEEPCFPAKNGKKADSGPYSHALSNVEDNRLQTGLNNKSFLTGDLDIFPNPVKESARIRFQNASGEMFTLFLSDVSGKVCLIINDISGSEFLLQTGDLKGGIYFVELRGNRVFRGRMMIE